MIQGHCIKKGRVNNVLNIVGDSFSEGGRHQNKNEISYIELLEKKFTIKNYSHHGVGPQYIFEKFINEKISGGNLFIVFPDIHRIKFNYLSDDNVASPVFIWNRLKKDKEYNFPESFEKYERKYEKIYKDFESFEQSNMFSILPTLYIQYFLSFYNTFDKILIWPTSFYHNLKLNFIPENCKVMHNNLNRISKLENVNKNENGIDSRNNHLSRENHEIMCDFLVAFFINDIFYEPNFKKNLS